MPFREHTGEIGRRYGNCHCGAISFRFSAPAITDAMLCNCSICRRKGALLSTFLVPGEELTVDVRDNALATYQFGTMVAKHQFCRVCGVSPFVSTRLNPGQYRINLGCVEGLDLSGLEVIDFDGTAI
ncbi:MAG: GFA family protein [Pseudomonadota bacterium]